MGTLDFVPDAERQMAFNSQLALLDNNDLLRTVQTIMNELVSLIRAGISINEMPSIVAPTVTAPEVHVSPSEVDLRAITDILVPVLEKQDMTEKFDSLTNLLTELVKRTTEAKGVGGTQSWTNINTRGIEAKLDLILRKETDTEERIEYDGPQAIYIGKALNGTDTDDPSWNIQKLTYTSNQVTRIQTLNAVTWDDRSTAAWT